MPVISSGCSPSGDSAVEPDQQSDILTPLLLLQRTRRLLAPARTSMVVTLAVRSPRISTAVRVKSGSCAIAVLCDFITNGLHVQPDIYPQYSDVKAPSQPPVLCSWVEGWLGTGAVGEVRGMMSIVEK